MGESYIVATVAIGAWHAPIDYSVAIGAAVGAERIRRLEAHPAVAGQRIMAQHRSRGIVQAAGKPDQTRLSRCGCACVQVPNVGAAPWMDCAHGFFFPIRRATARNELPLKATPNTRAIFSNRCALACSSAMNCSRISSLLPTSATSR